MKQFDDLTEKTIEKLKIYQSLLEKWQKKINLISPLTINDIWKRHILDSAQLYPLIPNKIQTLVDLGSGAGFPGLVLAIINQTQGNGKWSVHLVESDSRKCVFMQEVARHCGINVVVHNCRIEGLTSLKADVITARALKETNTLLGFALPLLKPHTMCLFLKGENADLELEWAAQHYSFMVEKIPSITEKSYILKMTEIHQ